jgi:hypothetical protein
MYFLCTYFTQMFTFIFRPRNLIQIILIYCNIFLNCSIHVLVQLHVLRWPLNTLHIHYCSCILI